MAKETQEILEFGPFRLDASEALLTRLGKPVSLSPRVFDLLVYVSTNAGRLIEKEELLKALWPDSFVEESNLTVNMAALRKALGTQDDGLAWIETIPKRGYRFLGNVTRPVVDAPPVSSARSRSRTLWISVAAVVAAGLGAYYFYSHRTRNAAPQEIAIAILPFIELSGSENDSHPGLGMTDALITKLAALPELTVRSMNTVRRYEGADPLEAGKTLKVDTVLAGSVQRLDKRIRVTVRLLRVRDGQSLWADKFDEFFTNVFAVQDSISEKMASVLALRLSSEQQDQMMRRFTESTEAFRLFELGRSEQMKAPARAREFFEMSIREDPRYALPYVELAEDYVALSGNGTGQFRKYAPMAREAAGTALRLAPDFAEAHIAAANVKRSVDRDFKAAEREIDAALRLNPQSAMAHESRGILLAVKGDLSTALMEAQLAVRLDPFNPSSTDNLAWILHCLGRDEAAIAVLDEFQRRDPRTQLIFSRFYCYLKVSRVPEAIALMEPMANSGNAAAKAVLAHAYALAGQPDKARTILRSLSENWGFYQRAVVELTVGNRDAALDDLDKAVDEHSVFVEWIKVDPDLTALHSDERFAKIAARAGLNP